MRKALNDNPIAQIAVVAVLLVLAALLLMTGVLKKDEPASGPATPAAATLNGPGETVPSAATPASTVPVASGAPSALPTGPLGPPLPAAFTRAQGSGETIVLLFIRRGGIEDGLVRSAVETLRSVANLAVFVVPAVQMFRYARVTQGLGIDRVPALVVIRPSSSPQATPEARVSYGFRSPESVVQALRDGLYEGPTLPYSPD